MLSSGSYISTSSASRTRAIAGRSSTDFMTNHIETQNSRLKTDPCKIPYICCCPCIYNITMPTYSGCHSRDVHPLIYTGASNNHIVYTAGTSGSVKESVITITPNGYLFVLCNRFLSGCVISSVISKNKSMFLITTFQMLTFFMRINLPRRIPFQLR